MSKQVEPKEMVRRILAVAEILATVATPKEVYATNQSSIPIAGQGDQQTAEQHSYQETKQ